MDIDWSTVNPDVVMPLSANRMNAVSELVTVTSHSGNVENDSALSVRALDCSLESMAVNPSESH
jgi:hypothetical protein